MPAMISLSESAPGWFEARFPFDRSLIDKIKKVAGCRWNPEKKCWVVPVHAVPALERFGAKCVYAKRIIRSLPAAYPDLLSKLRPYQQEGVGALVSNPGFVLGYGMRVGKGGRPSDRILTPWGWTTYGEVRPGQFVVGSNGLPTRVVGVFHRGTVPFMRVEFSDGAAVSVSDDHLWRVETPKQRHAGSGSHAVLATWELARTGLHDKSGNARWFIPMVEPIEFYPRRGTIDPYVIGVLIGDGYLGDSVSICTGDAKVLEAVEARLPAGVQMVKKVSKGRAASYTLKGMLPHVRKIGLRGRAWEKEIPDQYLFGSVRDRMDLLRGLVDTDGHIFGRGMVEYTTTSKKLAEQVRFLVETLGGTASLKARRTSYVYRGTKKRGRVSYRLVLNIPPAIVPTLTQRWQPRTKFMPSRSIRSIVPDGEDRCICIKVEAEDQLYVTDRCIVTHNTPTASVAAAHMLGAGIARTFIVFCPGGVKAEWTRQFPQFTGLPMETVEGVQGIDPFVLADWIARPYLAIVVNYELLTGEKDAKGDIIPNRTMLDVWNLLTSRGPFVVGADELHEIRDRKKPRAQILLQYANHPYVVARWALTGTPLRNYPADMFVLWNFVLPDSMGSWSKYTARYAEGHLGPHGWKAEGRSNEDELNARLKAICIRLSREEVAPWMPKADRKVILCDMTEAQRKAYNQKEAALGALALAAMQNGVDEKSTQALKQLAWATTGSKIPTAIERVRFHAVERAASEGRPVKVLVLSYFHETTNALWDAFEKAAQAKRDRFEQPVFVAGGWMTPAKRAQEIERWRQTPGSAVLLANALSSGRGIDLADAETAIFIELTYVPADFLQAESRIEDIHLGKRKTPPLIEYILSRGTVDEDMARLLIEKIAATENVVGADAQTRGVNQTLRESGVVDRSVLSLSSEDPEVVGAALDSLRARLLGGDVRLVTSESDTTDNADAEEIDDDDDESGDEEGE